MISRLLIAYDGSDCADSALDELVRAGLPASLEARVVTVADIIVPPADEDLPADDVPSIRIPEVERHAKERSVKAIKEATAFAERGVARLKEAFPGWDVTTEVCCDSPAWAVVNIANRDRSDLIVVGAHGHSVIGGRLILGSVSQRILHEARCSVRVARCWEVGRDGPIRILVGFNGSPDSEEAINAVVARSWPMGSEARLTTAHGPSGSPQLTAASHKLLAAGLTVSEANREGDPAHVLIKEAEEWAADSIFVGTRDVHGLQHLLHGSVSSAVAARARCSVEVCRATNNPN